MILLKLWLLLIVLKACGTHGGEPPDKIWNVCENDLVTLDKKCHALILCYKSKLAKDSGNWKAGGRFKVKRPNERFTYECAGNDETKGWHAVRISNDSTGMVTLDTSFSSKPLIVNTSIYPKINITKALTSDGKSFGVEFLKAINLGALMIDFDEMALQIAALEIRQSIGKKDTKLCKTKCAAKMPKAQHVNHLGINCMQIEFPIEIPNFSLRISTSPYWIACADHQRDDKADHITDNYTKYMEVASQDQFNACSKVPTSFVCNKSLELYACYKSINNQTLINKEIAEVCQKHLNQASFVAGFRIQMCVHREAEKQMLVFETILEFSSSEQIIKPAKKFPIKFGLKHLFPFRSSKSGTKQVKFMRKLQPEFTKLITRQINSRPYEDIPNKIHPSRCDSLGDDCEPIRQLMRKIDEMREWCAPFNPSGPCIGPRRTPTSDDLKPFMRPPWDNMHFPSTEIPPIDKKTDDPLEDGSDVLVTKQQAQEQYNDFIEACAECRRPSSKLEKEKRRRKRSFVIGARKWTKFPIAIKFDSESLGEGKDGAKFTIGLGVQQLTEKTCINFTFDASNAKEGILIIDNGRRDICGQSDVGQTSGWQSLSINCHKRYAGPHELLHALGLHHEDQRNDSYNFIKLNPYDKDNSAKTDNYEFAYDFGSIMHYPPEGSHNIYKRITLNRFYQQTIGQREKPSFKDFAIINSIYCNDTRGAQNVCQNGGYPNPRRCWECFCPDGYGGRHCETLEENFGCISVGVQSPRELEADWQTRTFNPSMKCVRSECKCHWRIKPKNGKKLRIQFKRLDLWPRCSQMPCGLPFFEIKFRKDKRARGARLCCPDAIAQMSPSQNWIEAEEPGTDIIIFARLIPMDTVTIELTYETVDSCSLEFKNHLNLQQQKNV
ncbi:hypothetical protein GPALN_015629 [Globodera pallida]|nr:hypothetical protein GPALN_015629 [Globodera pallida]